MTSSYYWNTVFGGYAKPAPGGNGPDKSLYHGCKTDRAVLRPDHPLPSLDVVPRSARASELRNRQPHGAEEVQRGRGDCGRRRPVPAERHICHAESNRDGAYKLQSWKIGDKLVLVRNDKYWGPKAKTKTVILRPISDTTARVQALQTGEIDFANNLTPQDVSVVKSNSNLKVQYRPAFNVGYVGMNQKIGPLSKFKVRQAIAYGLDRKSVVNAFYAGQGQVADQFLPQLLPGYAKKGVPQYTYNPAKAKQLLQEAGEKLPVELEFWYPTDRPRGYMPDPPRNFQAFTASLEKSGFKITPHPGQWRGGYVSGVTGGQAEIFLFGWTGTSATRPTSSTSTSASSTHSSASTTRSCSTC